MKFWYLKKGRKIYYSLARVVSNKVLRCWKRSDVLHDQLCFWHCSPYLKAGLFGFSWRPPILLLFGNSAHSYDIFYDKNKKRGRPVYLEICMWEFGVGMGTGWSGGAHTFEQDAFCSAPSNWGVASCCWSQGISLCASPDCDLSRYDL